MTDTVKLDRALGLWSVVLFGLAYMTPMIVFGAFGALAAASQGTTAMAYLIAAGAILLTAISYGVMARVYPVAGSAYTYARKSISPSVGFLVGWAVLLDYFFLPMVIWLIGAAYLTSAFPTIPTYLWIIGFIALTTVVNVVGIAFANRVNFILMVVQLAVLAAFVFLAARYVMALNGPGGIVSATPFFKADVPFSASIAGAAIAAYSFLGFDAVSTLTEETKDAKRTMPKAILITALAGGLIFVVSAYVTQVAHPGAEFFSVDAAATEIAKAVGGNLHPKWHTPFLNLILVGIVGLLALKMDVTTSTSFINFGAFLAFTAVNVSVITLYMKGDTQVKPLGVLIGLVTPALAAVCDLFLLWNLDNNATILGLVWLVVGIGYLAYLTRFFRAAPPEMDFAE
jgi:amino acid transporter